MEKPKAAVLSGKPSWLTHILLPFSLTVFFEDLTQCQVGGGRDLTADPRPLCSPLLGGSLEEPTEPRPPLRVSLLLAKVFPALWRVSPASAALLTAGPRG